MAVCGAPLLCRAVSCTAVCAAPCGAPLLCRVFQVEDWDTGLPLTLELDTTKTPVEVHELGTGAGVG